MMKHRFLHDKKRLELIGDSNEKTYVGEMNCGAACYVMNYILLVIKYEIHHYPCIAYKF